MADYNDGISSGGLVIGGEDPSSPHPFYFEGPSRGGLVLRGGVSEDGTTERWSPSNIGNVAVTGGFYRIDGSVYELPNTMVIAGLGNVATLVQLSAPPSTHNYFRYDLLSISPGKVITVTEGVAALNFPAMPALPGGNAKINHILRYHDQGAIVQSDIGKLFTAPHLTRIVAVANPAELQWNQSGSGIQISLYDQYGRGYAGGYGGAVVINASLLMGNGTVSPMVTSTWGASAYFSYTRSQLLNDKSPWIQFNAQTAGGGVATQVHIKLYDEFGAYMY